MRERELKSKSIPWQYFLLYERFHVLVVIQWADCGSHGLMFQFHRGMSFGTTLIYVIVVVVVAVKCINIIIVITIITIIIFIIVNFVLLLSLLLSLSVLSVLYFNVHPVQAWPAGGEGLPQVRWGIYLLDLYAGSRKTARRLWI